MSAAASSLMKVGVGGRSRQGRSTSARWMKRVCVTVTILFVGLFLFVPLLSVFYEAFRGGWGTYKAALTDENSLHAIKMTLIVAAIAVPLNTVFGVAAAWAIAKFTFKGKSLLTTVIDIPFAVSPVIAGLIFVLLFGQQGLTGWWLADPSVPTHIHWVGFAARGWPWAAEWVSLGWQPIRIIFALPAMVLVTVFVTVPFVARELIPLMQEQGTQEEQAAISLGATGWQTFWRITVPNIKWGLLYGIILCNARAMGEFGAISVVTQNLPGETNTLPREIEYLYSNFGGLGIPGAFALSTVLAMLGLVTLVAKSILEWKIRRDAESTAAES